jgi:hypothetical protein
MEYFSVNQNIEYCSNFDKCAEKSEVLAENLANS